eukprot:TRINITY_DN105_c0_g2_i1.p2 TRINITY_DN105_c0_g2~~TRINITY_DN105_c0_g2_i1.p2  ORF type:complete len:127 (+),score=23.96 TRINITY_DN105_c0_g2_i1:784-1164(+)
MSDEWTRAWDTIEKAQSVALQNNERNWCSSERGQWEACIKHHSLNPDQVTRPDSPCANSLETMYDCFADKLENTFSAVAEQQCKSEQAEYVDCVGKNGDESVACDQQFLKVNLCSSLAYLRDNQKL